MDCSESAYNGTYSDGHPSESTAYTGFPPDGYPSGSLLKGGSSTWAAQSQPIMGLTLMATRASQQPTRVFTLTATLGESPERWRLTHSDCSESAYNETYPDGHLNESTAYTGLPLTATPRRVFWKMKARPHWLLRVSL